MTGMDTHVRTPQEIFLQPQHLVVPPFQRSYVWDKDEQWAPLWQDVRRLAELRLGDRFANPTHFLGAVVVQAQEQVPGTLQASSVIDGQQRLTTLQLLMDAAGAVLEEAGKDSLAAQLDVLTHNQAMYVPDGATRLKVRHTNRDHAAFDEVMNADPPIDHGQLRHSGSLLARAHDYFTGAVVEWLGDFTADNFADRAETLVQVLTRGLQLVAINLAVNENSQEIFETLNARGTPLTAADLIKNFVFQRLDAEGADTRRAYAKDWPFDTKFWETEVSVGRYPVSRGSLFFNQWLVSRTGEEVSPKSTFTRFKQYVERESGQKVTDLLPAIKNQADRYEGWTVASDTPDRQLTRVEMAVYRMKASDVELLKPLLIWLHSPDRDLPQSVIDQVVAAAESWVVRRQLLRLTGSDLGRIVAEIIQDHSDAPAEELPDRVRTRLSRLNVSSTYWPGDAEIRQALQSEQAYRRFKRGRLRMLLEAIEDHHRHGTNQPQVPRRGYPIEHILPQKWTDTWPVDGLEAEQNRASHVHRLGNLTLLTSSLNRRVSNGPWTGKREALQQHDTLLMNSRLLAAHQDTWDEDGIDARTSRHVELLLQVWPVPEGHEGTVVDPQTKAQDWIRIKHLVAANLLAPNTVLTPRAGQWEARTAVVRQDGLLEIDGKTFDSPSGAGKYVKAGATNGWFFWRLPDGRKLVDVRSTFTGEEPAKVSHSFDWSALHALLEAIPAGRWTTYGHLADVVGTAPQPLGSHVTHCALCSNAHRILTREGRLAENFTWTDPSDDRDPVKLLQSEGLVFTDGHADRNRQLTGDDLDSLDAD
jgi:alkylated DNA nucleotide flippase Atl1